MKKFSFFLVCGLVLSLQTITAQSLKYNITGKITDQEGVALEWASALIFHPEDSTMITFAYSGKEGNFLIKNLFAGKYIIKVGYLGMAPYEQEIEIAGPLDLGTIRLEQESQLIEGAEVKAARIPILINKDTIEYDAESFKVAPNANVEELLKRLPGVEVEQDGTIKAQGETVQNVLVDGRRFFGDDPKMATRNIQADAVEKVKIYDRKSDVAEFTGVDDGSRERTINLQLKPDRKNGVFGYASGGYGPDNRYDGKLNLNRFSDTRQVALLAGTNNINQQGFSFQDYMQFSGGVQQMARGGGGGGGTARGDSGVPINQGMDNGFTTSGSAGLQFTQRYGKENELNTSYFFNMTNQQTDRQLQRVNFLPGDRLFETAENNLNLTDNYNHRLNINWDQMIDTFNSVKLISSLNFTDAFRNEARLTSNFGSPTGLDNSSENSFISDGAVWRINGSLTWRRRFEKRGRILATTVSGNQSNNTQEGALLAVNRFLSGETVVEEDLLDQLQNQDNQNWGYSANIQYTEPLGNRQYLELQYLYNHAPMRNERLVYDRFGQEVLIIVPELSSAYAATFAFHRPGINYRRVRDKTNFSAGLNWQASGLRGNIEGIDSPINNSFNYILPNIRFNYSPVRTKNLNLDYTTNVREPSILQLQPLPNNTDPLNIYEGNPNLEPEYTHRLSFRYSTFNMTNFQNFFVFGNLSYTDNKIRENQIITEDLVVIRQPINVRGEWDWTARVNYSYPIAKTGLRVNAGVGLSYNWGLAFINNVENQTQRISPNGQLRLFYQLKEKLDLEAGSRVNLIRNRYSISSEQNQNLETYTHNFSIRSNWPEKWQFRTGLDLVQYRGQSGVFNENVPIWTASISRFVLPKDRGEIKILAYDLLNRNIGISRTVNINYIQDEQIISLGRYFLLEFRYNINASPQAGGMGRGMQMMRFLG